MRRAIAGLRRSIFTTETAKHRIFHFFEAPTIAEGTVCVIASDDAFHLGVLSSHIHSTYALAAGGTLEDRPRYNKTRCFDPFPFPHCTEPQKARIRDLAEALDAHRKRAQADHALGVTDIYNVLERVRAGEVLTAKDKKIHDAALVSTLKQLHDELDAAVADAYGWPWPLPDAEILTRVVALNAQRAAEEASGTIRHLRPEYQAKSIPPVQAELHTLSKRAHSAADPGDLKSPARKSARATKLPWPKTMAERTKAIDTYLATEPQPITLAALTKKFTRAKEADVQEILETLAALGRARQGDERGTYVR